MLQTHSAAHGRRGNRRRGGKPSPAGVLAIYPGLRREGSGSGVEWFLRARRPLAGDGIAIGGQVVMDIPCDEDTSELLDAMDREPSSVDRRALDAAIADERAFLDACLAKAVGLARGIARRDMAQPGVDARAYATVLSGRVSNAIELFPAGCEDEGRDYRPDNHAAERVRAACAAALSSARKPPKVSKAAGARPDKRREGGGHKGRGRSAGAPRPASRTSRPIRMRRWSPLYE